MYIRPKVGDKVKFTHWKGEERFVSKGVVIEKKEAPRGFWGGKKPYLYVVEFDDGKIRELNSSDLDYDR